jgi:hypothetical protein
MNLQATFDLAAAEKKTRGVTRTTLPRVFSP